MRRVDRILNVPVEAAASPPPPPRRKNSALGVRGYCIVESSLPKRSRQPAAACSEGAESEPASSPGVQMAVQGLLTCRQSRCRAQCAHAPAFGPAGAVSSVWVMLPTKNQPDRLPVIGHPDGKSTTPEFGQRPLAHSVLPQILRALGDARLHTRPPPRTEAGIPPPAHIRRRRPAGR